MIVIMALRTSKCRLLLLSLSITGVIFLFITSANYPSLHAGGFGDSESVGHLAFADNHSLTVTIPRGAASPEVDITKLSPIQWYSPSQIAVNQNDTVTWINRDTEVHTVTSGIGAGLESLLNNKQGIKNGIFDSGIFKPGGNWTYKFVNPGTYQYFCTVHPWMEGTVVVKNRTSPTFPNYPVDAVGQRQDTFPVHTLTKDSKYDIDMSWSPNVLLAGEKTSFILDFSDPKTNNRHHLLPYDFIIFQDGKEVLRKASLSQAGSDVQEFIFSNPGPINIRVENVGDDKGSFTDFNSTVYENPGISRIAQQEQDQEQQSQSSSLPTNPFKVNTLTLVWITYTIIGVIPVAVAVVYILYRKRII